MTDTLRELLNNPLVKRNVELERMGGLNTSRLVGYIIGVAEQQIKVGEKNGENSPDLLGLCDSYQRLRKDTLYSRYFPGH